MSLPNVTAFHTQTWPPKSSYLAPHSIPPFPSLSTSPYSALPQAYFKSNYETQPGH